MICECHIHSTMIPLKNNHKTTPNYTWVRVNDTVVELQRPFQRPSRYTKEALEFAIANTQKARSSFTEEAFALQLQMFEAGRAYFPNTVFLGGVIS